MGRLFGDGAEFEEDDDVGRKADLLGAVVANKLLVTLLVLFDVVVGTSWALLVVMIPDDDECG